MLTKFLYVGVVTTIVDYTFYSIFIYSNLLSPTLAIVIGYLFGFALSFILTRHYVFSQIRVDNIYREFIIVSIIALFGLLLNIVIVKVLYNHGVDLYSGRVVSIGIVFFFNYYARKVFVYA